MKKEYISPSMKAYKVMPVSIICGSGGSSSTLSGGDDGGAPEVVTSNGFNGIFGD